jgi:hypothetical protein
MRNEMCGCSAISQAEISGQTMCLTSLRFVQLLEGRMRRAEGVSLEITHFLQQAARVRGR